MTVNEVDISGIIKCIPHRFPFLLIDRIIDFEAGKYAVGLKNVTINEHFFSGHFPAKPVMPGVLIIEALAQTSGVLVCMSKPEVLGKLVFFTSITDAKFTKTVVPGDQLLLNVQVDRHKLNLWKFIGQAKVGDDVVAEAKFAAMIVEP